MMIRTRSEAHDSFVTFGAVDGLTFNRRPVTARLTDDDIDVDGLPDPVMAEFKVEHFYMPADGEPHQVNWVAWNNGDGHHLMLSVNAIFVMNDGGATIDRIGEL